MKGLSRTRVSSFVVGFTLIFAVAGGGVTMAQHDRLIRAAGITLFDNADFRGRAVTFRDDVPNLAKRGFNDRARSIRVGPGEQWEVCEAANFQMRCLIVSGEERDLRNSGWNNIISSLRRVGGAPVPPGGDEYVVLFTGPRYTGSPTNFKNARANILKNARSATVGRGTWQLCDRVGFTGRCVTLNQSVPDLSAYNIRGPVRSVRPVGSETPPAPIPPAGNPYVVLFDQVNYRGVPTNYNRSRADISTRAMSMTVGAGTWEICDRANFTGRCHKISQSVPNLRSYNISQVIRSVRPIAPEPR